MSALMRGEQAMVPEDTRERMRRSYHLEKKSLRQIAREEHSSRETVKRAVFDLPPKSYQLTQPKPTFVFGQPFQARVEALLKQNDQLPQKQRYSSRKMFETLRAEGYEGSESRIRQYIAQWKRTYQTPKLFLPLEFEPGQDAQCDWGEAIAIIGGVRQTVQVFVMRLCYSRKTFVMTFPTQRQESFLFGHVQAFKHFGGVPARISYDNLATAVKLAMDKGKGRKRIENRTFVAFRSHYLFESHFCTPGAGWEKGQVEHSVGFSRRNFMVPIPEANSFEELNQLLVERCLQDEKRRVNRQPLSIGQAWEQERPSLLPLPPFEYECCETVTVRLTPYSQATYETNRYSVPVNRARREVTVKAYPFTIDIVDKTLLEQRPGAFDYAKPLRRWKQDWPGSYHTMLHVLREKWPEGRGIQEFVRILQLHKDYSADLIERAVGQALSYGCVHLDGVLHCLHQLTEPKETHPSLDLSDRPHLQNIGNQPVDLSRYEKLLKYSW
jgi:transposase